MTSAQHQELQNYALDMAKSLRGLLQAMRKSAGGADCDFEHCRPVRRTRRLIERLESLNG